MGRRHASVFAQVARLVPVGALFAVALAAPATARAQCTTCSPLALPSGGLAGADLGAARASQWSVAGQVGTGWVSFPRQVFHDRPVETAESARFDLFLTSLNLAATHKSGFGGAVTLPFGVLSSRVGSVDNRETSLGDLEVRPRYATLLGSKARLTLNAGAALPTGGYTVRSGAGALGESSRALTIGRGVPWAIAGAEVRTEPVRSVFVTGGLEGRAPLGEARDGFRWGPEGRASVDVEARPLGPMLGFAVGAEAEARAAGSIVDPFLEARVRSTNVRATVVSVAPSLRGQWGRVFAALTVRVPVYQDQEGLQFRQGLGLFASIGGAIPVGSAPPVVTTARAKATDAAPRFVVEEYGATWCEPCKRLAPILDALPGDRPDVRVTRFDVTDWSDEELAARVPDVHAFPVVFIKRTDGQVVARLEGEDVFRFRSFLSESP